MNTFLLLALVVVCCLAYEVTAQQDFDMFQEDSAASADGGTINRGGKGRKNKKNLTPEELAERKAKKEAMLEKRRLRQMNKPLGADKYLLLWEEFLIQESLNDQKIGPNVAEYKEAYVDFVATWSVDQGYNETAQTIFVEKMWTRTNKNVHKKWGKKNNMFQKVLDWTSTGECSSSSGHNEHENTLSSALKKWGSADVKTDTDDNKVENLSKIYALAKAAGLAGNDGKLCLCI